MADKETRAVRKSAGKKGTKAEELATMASGLHSVSESWYSGVRATWAENYRYWQGGRDANLFAKSKDLPVAIAWMVVDGVISAMTDGRPKPVFLPEEGTDKKMAEAVARIISGPVWEMLKMDEVNEDVIKAALAMSGAAVTKVGVDDKGFMYDTFVDPYHCHPEPNVRQIEDMEFFMTRVPMPVAMLRHAFGSAADHVQAENIDDDRRMYMGGATRGYKLNSKNMFNIWGNDDDDFASQMRQRHGRAILEHLWIADYDEGKIAFDEDEVEEEHERAGEYDINVHWWENHPEHVKRHVRYLREIQARWDLERLADGRGLPMLQENIQVVNDAMEQDLRVASVLVQHINEHLEYPQSEKGMLYPHGREVWLCQGKVLLERASRFGNPYHAFHFDRDLAGNFWGKSLMSYIVGIQESFNKLISKVDLHADIVANGRFFYNSRSKILWDKVLQRMKDKKGRIVAMGIPVNGSPRDNVMWDYGGQMPAFVFNLLGMLERLAYSIGGYTEVMQGQIPDYASGAALGKAIQSAGVRIRKGVKHLGWYYRDKYRDYIKYLKHTDPLQIYRVLGEDDETVYHAFMNIDWDAMSDVRIDVRNVLGTFREEQFAKLQGILERAPNLAPVLLPAMAQFIDVPIDTKKLDREQELQNALGVAHDELGAIKAEMSGK